MKLTGEQMRGDGQVSSGVVLGFRVCLFVCLSGGGPGSRRNVAMKDFLGASRRNVAMKWKSKFRGTERTDGCRMTRSTFWTSEVKSNSSILKGGRRLQGGEKTKSQS